jgi:hypothetical protein
MLISPFFIRCVYLAVIPDYSLPLDTLFLSKAVTPGPGGIANSYI